MFSARLTPGDGCVYNVADEDQVRERGYTPVSRKHGMDKQGGTHDGRRV